MCYIIHRDNAEYTLNYNILAFAYTGIQPSAFRPRAMPYLATFSNFTVLHKLKEKSFHMLTK